jgi:hypothetical protein
MEEENSKNPLDRVFGKKTQNAEKEVSGWGGSRRRRSSG